MGILQDRLDQELEIRGYSLKTRKIYLSCVKAFVAYFNLPPGKLGPEEIRVYQLYLIRERGLSYSYFNQSVSMCRTKSGLPVEARQAVFLFPPGYPEEKSERQDSFPERCPYIHKYRRSSIPMVQNPNAAYNWIQGESKRERATCAFVLTGAA